LVTHLLELGRHGGGRLLDLGCGTGTLLIQLAPSFRQAVGIDPEPDMLSEAARTACDQGIGNVEWIRSSSAELYKLEPLLGRFDLVTIGTAFHFMEPHETLADLQRIALDGVVAVAYNGTPMWLHPDPWAKALRAVLEHRLGGPLSDTDFTAEALRAAEQTMRDLGYKKIERWEQTKVEMINLDFVVGHILSATSEDQISPADRQDFAQEISSAISAVVPAKGVGEKVIVRAVIGHTNKGEPGRSGAGAAVS
jgi:SAM-dependent methyltransferase